MKYLPLALCMHNIRYMLGASDQPPEEKRTPHTKHNVSIAKHGASCRDAAETNKKKTPHKTYILHVQRTCLIFNVRKTIYIRRMHKTVLFLAPVPSEIA